jgi:pimeloyl-ACP methyl ester carboxylesterase
VIIGYRPRAEGFIVRDGVRIAYQVFGAGPRALLLLPTWTIVHTDFWKLQLPLLLSDYTVVTFDGRGNGGSDRPKDPTSYAATTMVHDAIGVLDAAGIGRAGALSVSLGAYWAAMLSRAASERVAAQVFIAPYLPLGPLPPARSAAIETFHEAKASYNGWEKWNRHYWQADWPGFLEFFFSQCFTEPNSQPFIEHFVAMGLQTTPEICALTEDVDDLNEELAVELARQVRSPSLVIHGQEDAIAPVAWGERLAELAGSQFYLIRGGGHEPQLREADETNAAIQAFLASQMPLV